MFLFECEQCVDIRTLPADRILPIGEYQATKNDIARQKTHYAVTITDGTAKRAEYAACLLIDCRKAQHECQPLFLEKQAVFLIQIHLLL